VTWDAVSSRRFTVVADCFRSVSNDPSAVAFQVLSASSLSSAVDIMSWNPVNYFAMDCIVVFRSSTEAAMSRWYFGGFFFFSARFGEKNFRSNQPRL
jgi:hypothetical protein